MIKVDGLKKTYVNFEKNNKLLDSFKSLFNRKKIYKEVVKGISFNIQKGEIVGFIGSNGSGKTTTLKMLSGILNPTDGKVEVMGCDPWKGGNNFKKKISIVLGNKSQLVWDLPPIDSFYLSKYIYNISDEKFEKNLNKMTSLLDVERLLNVPVRTLSLGERMKMELICSLLHEPDILFLDEPTIGLDVVSQIKIQNFIKEYNSLNKTTIMLTSHYMSDIEKLCNRVIIINQGSIIYDGQLKKIKNKFQKEKIIRLTLKDSYEKQNLNVTDGKIKIIDDSTIEFKIESEKAPQKLNEIINKYDILDITINDIPIEEIISEIFEKGL